MTMITRIRRRRAGRNRIVFVCQTMRCDPPDDLDDDGDVAVGFRGRIRRIARHQPFSVVGGTVLRPVGDAMPAVQLLRGH